MTDIEKRFHDLTLLYLKNRNLTNLSPEELLDEYDATYKRICEHHNQKNNSKWLT
ncbi:hypothetical protein [Coprococcus comes]|uniref:hypothetical protein n=1 Tax=Coprococcus comes TaxID=410072 RepID=UPI0032194A59